MSRGSSAPDLSFRPVRVDDLELLLAWRSNPDIYEHFRDQEGPLQWEDHLEWFGSRPPGRRDYVIEYRGRRVGSVFLTADREVGVYVGERELWGEGIASEAVEWLCDRHGEEGPLFATVHEDNERSRGLFRARGFVEEGRDGEWIRHRHD